MALLALFVLSAVFAGVVIAAPVLRCRKELPHEPLTPRIGLQLAPVALSVLYLVFFRSEPSIGGVPQARPEAEAAMLIVMALQVCAVPLVLRGTTVSYGARVVYAVLSALGGLAALVLISFASR